MVLQLAHTKKLKIKEMVIKILALADIDVNGRRPWDLQVKDDRFYLHAYHFQNLGIGEAYMQGWVDCDCLDEFTYKLLTADIKKYLKINWKMIASNLLQRLINVGAKRFSFEVGRKHYDLGNNFYKQMLDEMLIYSCGYWKNANTLEEAQQAKLELICKKLDLKPGMRLLDIGCGWGGLIKYAVERFGVSAVGITISKEQLEFAREMCRHLPAEIRFQDYRELPQEKFERIVSVGMFEHVCHKNYRIFMETVAARLQENGLFLLHTIGKMTSDLSADPWIRKYIFPNSMLPSPSRIAKASENLLIMEDWHNFGADYDLTLMEWHRNLSFGWNHGLPNYDEKFKRMWNYYLLTCAGGFRAREMQLWQIVFSKQGVKGGYKSVR